MRRASIPSGREPATALTRLAVDAASGAERPVDGWFVHFLRLLTRYPEIAAWDAFWWESLFRHRQAIYRAIKGVRPGLRVGWHLHHPMSFNIFYRVGMNFARIRQFSDWVKPNVYPGASGGRSRNAWRNGIMATLLRDLRPEIAIGFLFDVLGYDSAHMPTVEDYLGEGRVPSWDADYVARETRRALAGFAPDVAVYPGLELTCRGLRTPRKRPTPTPGRWWMRAPRASSSRVSTRRSRCPTWRRWVGLSPTPVADPEPERSSAMSERPEPLIGVQLGPQSVFDEGVERVGPLPRLLFRGEKPVCFCEHCQAQAEAAGTRVDQAMTGYRDLYECVQGVRSGRESKPRDGVLVGVLRRLIQYPEILAWERHWQEAREACAQGIFSAIKAVSPQAEVGWHIDHQQTTWDAIYRAGADYAAQGENCDFLKLCVYHDVAGPRVRRWYLDRVAESLFRELSLEQSLGLFYAVMGLDPARQPTLAEMDERGFSTDYIKHEIGRCVEAVGDRCRVYGGIAFDVPFGAQGGEWTHFASDPEDVRQSVRAAFGAGASGVVASREYDEMRLPNLQAFGDAMREMGAG